MSPGHTRVTTADQATCPVREVLDQIGDKWTVLVICLLAERPHRFNELRRSIEGLSQRMLTVTLRRLERDGLVDRHHEPTIPPKVTYSLTARGQTLVPPIEGLMAWAREHREEIDASRRRYDAAAAD